MPCVPSSSGGHAAQLLISLAFGYAVLVLAKREVKPLNRLGKFIGWLIIAVSFIGLLCTAAAGLCRMCARHRMACDRPSVGCPFGGPRAACDGPGKMGKDDDDDDDRPENSSPVDKK